jgi:hypothetical protein
MTSRAQTRESRFVEVGQGLHGFLLGSHVFWVLRWTPLRTSLGEVAS